MIALSDVTIARGGRVLLEQASLTLPRDCHLGITGPNGCGKSTLAEVMLGHLAPEHGEVSRPRNLTTAYVRQDAQCGTLSALEYVMAGDELVMDLRAQRQRALEDGDGLRLAALEDQLGIAGAWDLQARAGAVLLGLGLAGDELERPAASLSGGWQRRLGLARALVARAELLVLDEPTNHLDLDAILYVGELLRTRPGCVLCISHDRDFLDSFATHILHFEDRRLCLYSGNYSHFEVQHAHRRQLAQAQREQQERRREHMLAFIERFRSKATKARQAQSMLKAMERMTLVACSRPPRSVDFEFPPCQSPSGLLLQASGVDCGYEGAPCVLRGVEVMIAAGDRIGLLGANGQGKTTLIKTLCRILAPRSGQVTWNRGLRLGYFAQHALDTLEAGEHALWHLQRLCPDGTPQQQLRSFLGSFGFGGERALTPSCELSGGERARLALALIVWQRPNLLLLDEPTNHLDLATREALGEALAHYEGALLITAHDRHLLELTTSRLLLAEDGRLREFDGDLEDYRAYILARRRAARARAAPESGAAAAPAAPEVSRRDSRRSEARFRQSLSPLRRELEQLEQQMESAQAELQRLDATLSSPAPARDMQQLLRERARMARDSTALEERYLLKLQELEDLQEEHRVAKL